MNTKLRCLLLDDELPGLAYLKMLCEQIPQLEVVKAFNDPLIFIADMKTMDFDFCILDIEMPQFNGLQVANLLDGKPVIFVTAYKEYATDAFDLDAVDYLQKPVKKERLQQAVDKVIKRYSYLREEKQFMSVNSDKGKAMIFFEQIALIRVSEIDSRDKTVFMHDGNFITIKNMSFDHFGELLPFSRFCRINKREVIALNAVRYFSFDEITISLAAHNGKPQTLTLSEVFREEFLQKVRV